MCDSVERENPCYRHFHQQETQARFRSDKIPKKSKPSHCITSSNCSNSTLTKRQKPSHHIEELAFFMIQEVNTRHQLTKQNIENKMFIKTKMRFKSQTFPIETICGPLAICSTRCRMGSSNSNKRSAALDLCILPILAFPQGNTRRPHGAHINGNIFVYSHRAIQEDLGVDINRYCTSYNPPTAFDT